MATYKTISLGSEGRNNFHNVVDICIRVAPEQYCRRDDMVEGIELTPAQIKRVASHFCGISDCCCGSHPDGWEQVDYDRVQNHLSREQASLLTGRDIDREEWDNRMYRTV